MVGPSVVKHLSVSETAWSWRHAEFPSFTVQHVHSRYIEQLVGKLLDTFCCVASVDVTEVETFSFNSRDVHRLWTLGKG